MEHPHDLLNMAQAAHAVGMSKSTFERRVRSVRIAPPHIMKNKKEPLFRRDLLMAWKAGAGKIFGLLESFPISKDRVFVEIVLAEDQSYQMGEVMILTDHPDKAAVIAAFTGKINPK